MPKSFQHPIEWKEEIVIWEYKDILYISSVNTSW